MFLSVASAPGKIILAGEHAVVYGRPALAAPLWQSAATCTIEQAETGAGCTLALPDLGQSDLPAAAGDPLWEVARAAVALAGAPTNPDWRITLRSTIPIAGGLGSGAALSAALVRAIFAAAGATVTPEEVSALVYRSEVAYHGTPSGIDNTVIACGRPLWFVRGEPPEFFALGAPLTLLIADSGVRSPTLDAVAAVRRAHEQAPTRIEALLDEIAGTVWALRGALEAGDPRLAGALFDANQTLLAALDVSSPLLERLVGAARAAGALGAKLSGGGRGGNIIALVEAETVAPVQQALTEAGAVRVIRTVVE